MTDSTTPANTASPTATTATIGVTGLAVMGSNIARNFAHHGYTVALHNRSIAKTDALLKEHGSEGKFVRSETIPEFLAALEKPRRVLIMVKAGDPTDAVINELADAMDRDVLGGNPIPGMWSFQMVEAYDDGFYARAKDLHQRALDELMDGQRHVFEAEMKELRRTRGRDGHEARPADIEGDPEYDD